MNKVLLVGGCARSGTTALRKWLNSSPWFYIGNERYTKLAYQSRTFDLDLFEPARFADVRDSDSAIPQLYIEKDAQRIAQTVELGGVFGDKIPRLADIKTESGLNDSDDVKYLVIVRNLFDVASSYKARAEEARKWAPDRGAMSAIKEWNRALGWASDHSEKANTFVLCYESFFFDDSEPRELYDFLEVPAEHIETLNTALEAFRKESAGLETRRLNILSPNERMEVCRRGKFAAYRKLLD